MNGSQRSFILTSALLGALAVGLGAFGAHGLKSIVSAEMLLVWETAVRYHLAHTLAIFICATATPLWQSPWARRAAIAWIIGIAFFSGSLYALVLSDIRILGAITPFGGVFLILGWIFLGLSAYKCEPAQ